MMGTNYYLDEPRCEHCGRDGARLHIGKSSMGWCFSLRIHPEEGINDLPDWIDRWSKPGVAIHSEYGDALTPDDMLKVILIRFGKGNGQSPSWLAQNEAAVGPFGLARCRLGGSCVKHGSGTYDVIVGEFS